MELHYLEIDRTEALLELEIATTDLYELEEKLHYTGMPPKGDHNCIPQSLYNPLACNTRLNTCTKLCTLIPRDMLERKIFMRRIVRAQERICKCQMETTAHLSTMKKIPK